MKECFTVQTAEYAVSHGIIHEPAYNWWVVHVFQKRDHIISAVKQSNTIYLKRMHKFGIDVPKTVLEAIALGGNNSDTLW